MADRKPEIAAVARELLETEGPDALTMRRIADVLGIKAPSLYKHVPNKAALEALVVAQGFAEYADALAAAVHDAEGTEAQLTALATTYRRFALAHPHLYRLMNYRPLRRDLLPAGLEDRAAAPLVRAVGGDPDRARALWAFAHGMVSLELDGRFPDHADLAAAWTAGMRRFADA